jgi:hypothetical protein
VSGFLSSVEAEWKGNQRVAEFWGAFTVGAAGGWWAPIERRPGRERGRRLQPTQYESVGTRAEPTMTVVHVAAAPRLEPGACTLCGIWWRAA